MGEDPCAPLAQWLLNHCGELDDKSIMEFISALKESRVRAEDECSYARTQVENDYDGWVSPDELKEYYIPKPISRDGMPLHDVSISI